jgi:hypothetical protein
MKSEQQQRSLNYLYSSLVLKIETEVMEMVSSMFYWLWDYVKLLGGGEKPAKVHTGLEMTNLVSGLREWRMGERCKKVSVAVGKTSRRPSSDV